MSGLDTSWHPDWTGQTCFILGGGPSLRGFRAGLLSYRRVIGVNEAGLSMMPSCDVLLWSDARWFDWNRGRLSEHSGLLKVARHRTDWPGVHRVLYRQGADFCWSPDCVAGPDAGLSAINLAVHFGAARIVLLGFDCRDFPKGQWRSGNWHNRHKCGPIEGQREGQFLPAHRRAAAALRAHGMAGRVVNATPDSVLDCWPMVKLGSVM